jgi:hypothetical protein
MTYVDGAVQENINKWVLGDGYPKYVDVPSHGCDHRVPTWGATQVNFNGGWEMDGDKKPVYEGTHIFKYNHNAIADPGAGGGTHPFGGGVGIVTLRAPEHWNVDPVRRGKLLTLGSTSDKQKGFWYDKTVIGLGDITYVEFGSGDASQLAGSCSNPAAGQNCDGIDGGKYFQPGDVIGVTGGHGKGAEFQVMAGGTEQNRRTGETGAIKFDSNTNSPIDGLKWRIDPDTGEEMRGEGYLPGDFAEILANGELKPGSSSSVRLVPKETGDKRARFNINPMVMAGKVVRTWVLDRAPVERGGLEQLSRSSNNGAGDEQSSLMGTTGRTIGTKQIQYNVSDLADQSFIYDQGNAGDIRDGSFDCFLYFHSDVGHNSTQGCGNFNNQQNFITLTITTL